MEAGKETAVAAAPEAVGEAAPVPGAALTSGGSSSRPSSARSARDAPVDFLGCHTMGEPSEGGAPFRFQTLLALILSARTTDAAVAHAMQRLRTLAAGESLDGPLTASASSRIDAAFLLRALDGVTSPKRKAEHVSRVAPLRVERYDGDVPADLAASRCRGGPQGRPPFLQQARPHGGDRGRRASADSRRLGWTRGADARRDAEQLEARCRASTGARSTRFRGLWQQVCSADAPAAGRAARRRAARPQIGVEDR